MPKKDYVQFRVSDEEKALLVKYAEQEKRTLSNYLLAVVFRNNGKLPPSEVAFGYALSSSLNPEKKILEGKSYLDVLKELSSRFKNGKWDKKESYIITQSGETTAVITHAEAEAFFG